MFVSVGVLLLLLFVYLLFFVSLFVFSRLGGDEYGEVRNGGVEGKVEKGANEFSSQTRTPIILCIMNYFKNMNLNFA